MPSGYRKDRVSGSVSEPWSTFSRQPATQRYNPALVPNSSSDRNGLNEYWIMHVIFDRSHVTVRNVQERCCCQQDSLKAYIGRLPSCHPAQTHRL